MATTPTALDDLRSLLSDSEKVFLDQILKNDKAKAVIEEGSEFRKAYLDDSTNTNTSTTTTTVTNATTTTAAPDPTKTATTTTASPVTTASADLSAITKQLGDLNTSLTAKLSGIEKDMVKKDDVKGYRGEILSTAIKNAYQVMRLETQHNAEFPSEPFDPDKIQAHLDAEAKKGRVFKDITEVYNDLYGEKRVQARIDKGIADGLKQKSSGAAATTAGGGSGAVALSPAQQAMKTFKGEGGTNDHEKQWAERLRKIREAREASQGGIEEAS